VKTTTLFVILIVGSWCGLGGQLARGQDIDSMPPVVVKTLPEAGSKDVPPGEYEIKITFSKEMQDHSWSWSSAWQDSTPEAVDAPRYDAGHKTCMLKVKLEAKTTYGYWLNSQNFHNFKDKQGHAAVPYLLVFETGKKVEGATSAAKPTTDQVIVEDLALEMLVAIRDKDNDALQKLAVDRPKAWREALPHFALEMRERIHQRTGKSFELKPVQSLVEGDRAVVKCTGDKRLQNYLVLYFVKTSDGWRNWMLRNSPLSRPLSEFLQEKPSEQP
jgi:hypothetical protein